MLTLFHERIDVYKRQVFAYKSIEYADLPPVIDLKIVKDLSEFTPPVVGNVLSK